MKAGRPSLRGPLVAVALIAAGGCLGTGARRVDAPCREMRGSVAREMLRDSPEIPILDVRSAWSRQLKGAVLIPLPELAERTGELSRYRSTPVVVVGDDSEAGRKACELLSGTGFKYVIYVTEGAEGLFAGVRGGLSPDAGSERRP